METGRPPRPRTRGPAGAPPRCQQPAQRRDPPPLISIQDRGTLIREQGCDHEDSALLVYYQSRTTRARDLACFTLANHIMSSTFFHELRTRQQLGYVVGAGNLPLNRHPGLIFYIQSPVAGPQILLDAVEEFIDLFPLAMLEFTEQQWQESKAGLQAQLSERDANLRSRGQRLWVSIGNKDLVLISANGYARRWAGSAVPIWCASSPS